MNVAYEVTDDGGIETQHTIARNCKGELYACYYRSDRSGGWVMFKKSTDNGVTWLNEVTIDNDDVPIDIRMAIDSNNDLHFVWTRSGCGKVYYCKYDYGSSTLGTIVDISDTGGSQGQIDIAVDSDDSIHVVWNNHSRISYRINNGSWGNIENISDFDSSYPSLCVDDTNQPHVAFDGAAVGSNGKLYYATKVFSWVYELVDSVLADVYYYPSIATNYENLLGLGLMAEVWITYGTTTGDIGVVYKVLGHWQSHMVVGTGITGGYNPCISILSNNTKYILWYYIGISNYVMMSYWNGISWESAIPISDGFMPAILYNNNIPTILTSGYVYLYYDYANNKIYCCNVIGSFQLCPDKPEDDNGENYFINNELIHTRGNIGRSYNFSAKRFYHKCR
jgi:hypothetical protein